MPWLPIGNMPKLVKVQHLRYEGPILHFDTDIRFVEVAEFVASVFRKYLKNFENVNYKVKARNTTIRDKTYGIFMEGCNGRNPLLEIAPTENGNVFAIKNIHAAISENPKIILNKNVFVSYLENNRGKELTEIGQ